MTKVVAFDPGGTSGWMTWDSGKPDSYEAASQISIPEHHNLIRAFLQGLNPDVIICETFKFRSGQPDADLISREYIGVIKLYYQQNEHVDLVMQDPHQAKGKGAFWSDDKLARVGMLITPKHPNRHANDAIRHFMYWYTFTQGNKSFLEKLK